MEEKNLWNSTSQIYLFETNTNSKSINKERIMLFFIIICKIALSVPCISITVQWQMPTTSRQLFLSLSSVIFLIWYFFICPYNTQTQHFTMHLQLGLHHVLWALTNIFKEKTIGMVGMIKSQIKRRANEKLEMKKKKVNIQNKEHWDEDGMLKGRIKSKKL